MANDHTETAGSSGTANGSPVVDRFDRTRSRTRTRTRLPSFTFFVNGHRFAWNGYVNGRRTDGARTSRHTDEAARRDGVAPPPRRTAPGRGRMNASGDDEFRASRSQGERPRHRRQTVHKVHPVHQTPVFPWRAWRDGSFTQRPRRPQGLRRLRRMGECPRKAQAASRQGLVARG
jgi:hypothetical protein